MSRAERIVVLSAVACLTFSSWSCGDDDGGGEPKEGGGGGSDEQKIEKVAMALTGGVEFENGSIVAALLPDPDNETVELDQSATTLRLEPGGAEILPLEVSNPDSADSQVEAVLLQFEGADEHVQVEVEGSEDETETFNLPFSIDAGICDALCNEVVRLKLLQAVRMTDGTVSKHLERLLDLDCSDDGDADACEEDDAPRAGSSGSNPPGGGGSSGGGDSAIRRADTFASALIGANNGLCMCMGTSPCDAIYPRDSLDCIKDEITGATDSESVNGINMLTNTLVGARSACSACDMTTCPASLLADGLAGLPTDLGDAILECAGGTLPPESEDAADSM
jgi:hypothetical protein